MDDRPLKRDYARVERERRFLVPSLPSGIAPDGYQRLRDCFVAGTHLRLRVVEAPNGETIVAKLGQKIPDPAAPDDPRRRSMTTLYLPPEEAAALAFEGLRATKRRYKLPEQGWTFCIDVWEEPAAARGIILAEVECPTDEQLDRIVTPRWAEREVTEDPGYAAVPLARRL